jgi:hypothetical protein
MIIFKKCLGLCNSYNEEGLGVVQMIIELGGAMRMFEDVDKSDLILQLTSLVKKLLSNFIKSVLKNKSNMNQNEYLLKIE